MPPGPGPDVPAPIRLLSAEEEGGEAVKKSTVRLKRAAAPRENGYSSYTVVSYKLPAISGSYGGRARNKSPEIQSFSRITNVESVKQYTRIKSRVRERPNVKVAFN